MKTPALHYLSPEEAIQLTKKRKGERRIGEMAEYLQPRFSLEENLKKTKCKFVLLGIPEDIGVRANFGRGGTHTAWKPALENILSIQSNSYFSGKELFVLGAINFDELMKKSEHLNPKIPSQLDQLRIFTGEIDIHVSELIQIIVSHGKIPIVIGGGHNNAYGNLKGSATALKIRKKLKNFSLNAINCDAHADLRALEGRHSGNGFSYAMKNEFLNKYAVLGLHENYFNETAELSFKQKKKQLLMKSYEDIFVRENISLSKALNDCIRFVSKSECGVELDLDSITNVPSSAKTSSGISPAQARQFAYRCGKELNAVYFHIAEGAPVLAHRQADNKTGKLIGYLVTDFIKGVLEKK